MKTVFDYTNGRWCVDEEKEELALIMELNSIMYHIWLTRMKKEFFHNGWKRCCIWQKKYGDFCTMVLKENESAIFFHKSNYQSCTTATHESYTKWYNLEFWTYKKCKYTLCISD